MKKMLQSKIEKNNKIMPGFIKDICVMADEKFARKWFQDQNKTMLEVKIVEKN